MNTHSATDLRSDRRRRSACIGGFYGRPMPSASDAASAYELTRISYEKAKHAMDVYRRAKEMLDRSRRAMGERP